LQEKQNLEVIIYILAGGFSFLVATSNSLVGVMAGVLRFHPEFDGTTNRIGKKLDTVYLVGFGTKDLTVFE
jgi:hypothetical protein